MLLFQNLKAVLDRGHRLPSPNGILINGRGPNGTSFTVEQGNFSKIMVFLSLFE